MIALRPIIHKDSYSELIEAPVLDYLVDVIYGPLADLLEEAGVPVTVQNAGSDPISAALGQGKLFYSNGTFSGRFTPAVSKELRRLGAKFNVGTREFKLAEWKLPADVKLAATAAQSRAQGLHQKVIATLDEMLRNVPTASTGMDFTKATERIVSDLNGQFNDSVKAVEAIRIAPEVTPAVRAQLNDELTNNLDLYVRKFTEEQVLDLRQRAEANAFAGGRADTLAKVIESNFGVSKRKAAFLAGQETSLAVSHYRQARYEEIGCERYRWSTSHDSIVRDDHKDLDGQIFRWDDPPVTNKRTMARNNPGCDFSCRCRAIPLIPTPTATLL